MFAFIVYNCPGIFDPWESLEKILEWQFLSIYTNQDNEYIALVMENRNEEHTSLHVNRWSVIICWYFYQSFEKETWRSPYFCCVWSLWPSVPHQTSTKDGSLIVSLIIISELYTHSTGKRVNFILIKCYHWCVKEMAIMSTC